MKNILKTVGLILASIMLISCGSTSGVRVTRESVTVMDHSGVGDVTTGENRVVRASNDFANVEIEYSSASKNQSETVKKALETAVWSKKEANKRLDDGTSDIDTLDAMEYTITRNMKYFIAD